MKLKTIFITTLDSLKQFFVRLLEKLQPYLGWLIEKLRPYAKKCWAFFSKYVGGFFDPKLDAKIQKHGTLLRVLFAMLVVVVLWASFFHIDQVVSAQGQIISIDRSQVIQTADGGVLTELKVNEGDTVKAGQVIAILERDRAYAAYSESVGKVTALRLTVHRLDAELSGRDLIFDAEVMERYPELVSSQMNLYKQRKAGFQSQVAILKDNIELAQQELAMSEPLLKFGDISKADYLKIKRAYNEARSALLMHQTRYFQEASAEFNKAQEDLNTQEQVLSDRTQVLDHTEITSPVNGIVKSVKVTTIGGVIRQGDEIMQILPTDGVFVVEAKIRPADMTLIHEGVPARIKLDAYDYTIFGSLEGKVSYLSADSLTEETKAGPSVYYRAKINIEKSEFNKNKTIDIKPGMTGSVDIKTGERTVMSYLLKPLTKTLTNSLGER